MLKISTRNRLLQIAIFILVFGGILIFEFSYPKSVKAAPGVGCDSPGLGCSPGECCSGLTGQCFSGAGCGGGGGGGLSPYDCPYGTHADPSLPIYPGECCRGSNCHTGTMVSSVIGQCNCRGDPSDPETQCDNLYYWYQCVPNCSATAPTGLAYTASNQNLTWTAGSGGVSQRLYVSADPNQVANNCTLTTSPGCAVNSTSASSPYSLSGVISPGTVYYAKVVNYESSSCSPSSGTLTFLSSCALSSSSVNVDLGDSAELASSVNSSSAITNVAFISSDPGIASATSPDAVHPYSTTIGGVSLGSTTVTSDVYFGAVLACSANAAVNVLTPDPWWQVKDGDTSSNGNLVSDVPLGKLFGLAGLGGYPGVAAFGGTTNLTTAKVSAPGFGWLAQSVNAGQKIFDFQYFANQAPGETVFNSVNPADVAGSLTGGGTTDADGYYWYKYTGGGVDISIDTAIDLGGRKVILFVDSADLLVNAPINLNDGGGFLLVIVGKTGGGAKGNIIVSPTVGGSAYDLEGIYMADGLFQTGIAGTALNVRGSVTGYGGISMQRDLTALGNLDPSEFYEYAPDQILLFPKKLGVRKINWKEVAP